MKIKIIFFQAGSGTNCVDIDECTIQNGGCDDICMNSPGLKIKQQFNCPACLDIISWYVYNFFKLKYGSIGG